MKRLNRYSSESHIRFNAWKFLPDVKRKEWEKAVGEASNMLPGGPEVVGKKGWNGVMKYLLGEVQFGAKRYHLGTSKRLYYHLKPILPRRATIWARRGYRPHQERDFPLSWPIEDRFVRFFWQCIRKVLNEDYLPIWPDGKKFAFVLTHDVETESGLEYVEALAEVETKYGFRSSFNLVPERYPVDAKLRDRLSDRGFEVGVHGLKHDGKLFLSKKVFEKRAVRINHYLKEWGAVGFRSPLTHRNPEWMQALEIEYDSSFFDTDPYEAMPGGTMTIWPFFIGHFVELPYTLPQDSTLFITLGETTIDIWKRKVDWIAENRGMVLVNVHPDYIHFENNGRIEKKRRSAKGKYPLGFYVELLEYVKAKGNYWHALPREVAKWWREAMKSD